MMKRGVTYLATERLSKIIDPEKSSSNNPDNYTGYSNGLFLLILLVFLFGLITVFELFSDIICCCCIGFAIAELSGDLGMNQNNFSNKDNVNSHYNLVQHASDPVNASTMTAGDSDGDGLTDIQEKETFRTNINKSDSDIDGLSDGKEVNGWFWFVEEQRGCINATLTITCQIHKTNPLSPDTDGDRNSDYYEYKSFGSYPTNPDQDQDDILDGLESGPNAIYHTSFLVADTDKDGLSDGQEIKVQGRDPTKPDDFSGAKTDDSTGLAERPGSNDAPIAKAQRVVTVRDDPVDIILTGSDKTGDTLYFFIATHPLHGTLSTPMIIGSSSAKITYSPLPNYAGEDSFTFWAYDGKAYSSSPGRVLIYVSP